MENEQEEAKYDNRYHTLKVWKEDTYPSFVELKALYMLRTGDSPDNVAFLDWIIKDALHRERERVTVGRSRS